MVPKVSAILFLSIIMVSQTPFQQVLKLPVLIEHFGEHKKENPSISFVDFIQLHYFSGNPKDDDYDRDQQLPFRSDEVIVLVSNVEVNHHQIKIDPLSSYTSKNYPLMDIATLPSTHSFDIWQPPKSC